MTEGRNANVVAQEQTGADRLTWRHWGKALIIFRSSECWGRAGDRQVPRLTQRIMWQCVSLCLCLARLPARHLIDYRQTLSVSSVSQKKESYWGNSSASWEQQRSWLLYWQWYRKAFIIPPQLILTSVVTAHWAIVNLKVIQSRYQVPVSGRLKCDPTVFLCRAVFVDKKRKL